MTNDEKYVMDMLDEEIDYMEKLCPGSFSMTIAQYDALSIAGTYQIYVYVDNEVLKDRVIYIFHDQTCLHEIELIRKQFFQKYGFQLHDSSIVNSYRFHPHLQISERLSYLYGIEFSNQVDLREFYHQESISEVDYEQEIERRRSMITDRDLRLDPLVYLGIGDAFYLNHEASIKPNQNYWFYLVSDFLIGSELFQKTAFMDPLYQTILYQYPYFDSPSYRLHDIMRDWKQELCKHDDFEDDKLFYNQYSHALAIITGQYLVEQYHDRLESYIDNPYFSDYVIYFCKKSSLLSDEIKNNCELSAILHEYATMMFFSSEAHQQEAEMSSTKEKRLSKTFKS